MTKGGTTFVQKEEFGGVLWWVMGEWLAGGWLKGIYEGFNGDLKRGVEGRDREEEGFGR